VEPLRQVIAPLAPGRSATVSSSSLSQPTVSRSPGNCRRTRAHGHGRRHEARGERMQEHLVVLTITTAPRRRRWREQ
jgi:hypothetical protein